MSTEINPEAIEELKQMLTPVNAAKKIFGTIIQLGAAAAVVAMMKNPVKAAHGIVKIAMAMGVFVLGCKAGDIAEEYFVETMDHTVAAISDIQKEIKQEGADGNNATDSDTGRDSGKQQDWKDKRKLTGSGATGETAASAVWWRRRSKEKASE